MNWHDVVSKVIGTMLSTCGILLSLLAVILNAIGLRPSRTRPREKKGLSRGVKHMLYRKPEGHTPGRDAQRRTNDTLNILPAVPCPPQPAIISQVVPPSPSSVQDTPIILDTHFPQKVAVQFSTPSNNTADADAPRNIKEGTRKCPLIRSSTTVPSPFTRIPSDTGNPMDDGRQPLFHRNSTGSLQRFSTKRLSCPLKHSGRPPEHPPRTEPYGAPYFFPAPGSPAAVDYVRKTREERMHASRGSRFIHVHMSKLRREKKGESVTKS